MALSPHLQQQRRSCRLHRNPMIPRPCGVSPVAKVVPVLKDAVVRLPVSPALRNAVKLSLGGLVAARSFEPSPSKSATVQYPFWLGFGCVTRGVNVSIVNPMATNPPWRDWFLAVGNSVCCRGIDQIDLTVFVQVARWAEACGCTVVAVHLWIECYRVRCYGSANVSEISTTLSKDRVCHRHLYLLL